MQEPSPTTPQPRDRSNDALRIQILATEHWSLLATRSMTWNEVFSRAAMFLTVLSAAVVALALVAQATNFGYGFRLFALLVLPIVVLVGLATYVCLSAANFEDVGLVVGMNRLRRAYLDLAPDLEPYFVTGTHDDIAGIMQSFGWGSAQGGMLRILASMPLLVGAIDAVVTGVLAALIADTAGAPAEVTVGVGIAVGIVVLIGLGAAGSRRIAHLQRDYHPRFPS